MDTLNIIIHNKDTFYPKFTLFERDEIVETLKSKIKLDETYEKTFLNGDKKSLRFDTIDK